MFQFQLKFNRFPVDEVDKRCHGIFTLQLFERFIIQPFLNRLNRLNRLMRICDFTVCCAIVCGVINY